MMDVTCCEQISRFFRERLDTQVPAPDTDLFDSGLLDSLAFIDLVVYLEQQFAIEIIARDLEPENFRTLAGIAEFVAERIGAKTSVVSSSNYQGH